MTLSSSSAALPPVFPAWPGILLGLVAAAGLAFVPGVALLPPPWDTLHHPFAFAAAGVSLGLLVTLLGEWVAVGRRWNAVRRLSIDDDSWAARAWQGAVTSSEERLASARRAEGLRRQRTRLARFYDRRWLCYYLLALVPATLGLIAGLRGLRDDPFPLHPIEDYFALLWAGSAASLLLIALAGLVRWLAGAMLGRWLRATLEREAARSAPVQPTGVEPSAATAAPAPRLRGPRAAHGGA